MAILGTVSCSRARARSASPSDPRQRLAEGRPQSLGEGARPSSSSSCSSSRRPPTSSRGAGDGAATATLPTVREAAVLGGGLSGLLLGGGDGGVDAGGGGGRGAGDGRARGRRTSSGRGGRAPTPLALRAHEGRSGGGGAGGRALGTAVRRGVPGGRQGWLWRLMLLLTLVEVLLLRIWR